MRLFYRRLLKRFKHRSEHAVNKHFYKCTFRSDVLCTRVTSEVSVFKFLIIGRRLFFCRRNQFDCMGLFIFCNFTCKTGRQCLLSGFFQIFSIVLLLCCGQTPHGSHSYALRTGPLCLLVGRDGRSNVKTTAGST